MVRFDNGTANIQPHAQALGLGAEEGLEQALGIGDAVAAVDHGHFQLLIVLDHGRLVADLAAQEVL